MPGPLHDVRVLDITGNLSGTYLTMQLADLGADVLKLERPGSGDPSRGTPPYVEGTSTYFASINRGQRSIVVDLKQPEGVELKLAERCDVLAENFLPGSGEGLYITVQCLSHGQYRAMAREAERRAGASEPVRSVAEASDLPQAQFRGMVADSRDRSDRDLRLIGSPMKLFRMPAASAGPLPELSEHTNAILADMLGLEDATLSDLGQRGLVVQS